jgi:hypothetical protein
MGGLLLFQANRFVELVAYRPIHEGVGDNRDVSKQLLQRAYKLSR